MALAWASTFAAVGPWRKKLQLLQPMAGVTPTPLSSAIAPGGPGTTVTAPATPKPMASATDVKSGRQAPRLAGTACHTISRDRSQGKRRGRERRPPFWRSDDQGRADAAPRVRQ